MNQPDKPFSEFSVLLDALLDGQLDEAQRVRLTTILRDDPEARAHYVALLEIHAELHWRHDQAVPVQPEPAVSRHDPIKVRNSLLGMFSRLPTTIQPTQHPARFLVAASLLTAVFCGTLLLMLGSPSGRGQDHRSLAKSEYVATITLLQDVVWSESQASAQLGTRLLAGNRLELKKGFVHLAFLDGARVVIEGPASLRIDAPDAMSLDRGRLLARVSKRVVGFTVETPNVEVVDLGTEFGIEVQEEETEVQVFEGTVQARRLGEGPDHVRTLSAGQAVAFGSSPQQGFYVKEKKMNRSIYLSLATVIALSTPQVATAAIILSDGSQAGNRNNFDGTVGTRFIVSGSDVVVNALGFEDATGAGFSQPHQVGLWTGAGTLLGSVTVPIGTSATLLGGWRYVLLPDDITLSSGQTYVLGGEVFSGGDFWTDTGTGTVDFSLETGIGPGSPTTSVFIASSFAFPTTTNPDPLRWAPGNATFIAPPAPEPTTGALLGIGGMMVIRFARKRRRQRRSAA